MFAEKATLLSHGEHEEAEPTDSPRRRSSVPRSPSPTPEEPTTEPLTSPGATVPSDPLSNRSPTLEHIEPDGAQPMSEKARGKMRATESMTSLASPTRSSVDLPDEELLRMASAGVGPNNYVPTQEWVSSWQKGYAFIIQESSCRC